jgi:hypothetical protein
MTKPTIEEAKTVLKDLVGKLYFDYIYTKLAGDFATDLVVALKQNNKIKLPVRGSHWTKEAFNLAQEMLERGCPKPLIIDRLKRHFVGPFTVSQLYDKIRKGALIAHPKKRGV